MSTVICDQLAMHQIENTREHTEAYKSILHRAY